MDSAADQEGAWDLSKGAARQEWSKLKVLSTGARSAAQPTSLVEQPTTHIPVTELESIKHWAGRACQDMAQSNPCGHTCQDLAQATPRLDSECNAFGEGTMCT